MKKIFLLGILALCMISYKASAASIFNTPNYNAARKVLAPDLSSYADYIVENCQLPDGKIATVYVFNSNTDCFVWQNAQQREFSPDFKQRAEEQIKWCESHGGDDSFWKWYPTGPLTPIFRACHILVEEYGKEYALEVAINSVSYYSKEDLGQLSEYMKSIDSAAQACYEDSDGVYLLTICRPKNLSERIVSKDMQKLHKNEFAYEVSFIPKEYYKFKPVKLNPAKTQPLDPSEIPESDRNLVPVAPKRNDAYYYDTNLANKLQWLAVKIACKGVYDMAYTGDSRARNPTDYYKTSFIKNYLAKNDGTYSKGTVLFEGICFDYADFAYQELKDNQKDYPNVANFWMVGTFENSSDIVAYKLAGAGENSTMTINRTPVVVFSHNHILAHEGATNHAWFWVQSTDGTVYWIDPTWTDNTGRPVYGIVRGGKEIQLTPSSSLCVR